MLNQLRAVQPRGSGQSFAVNHESIAGASDFGRTKNPLLTTAALSAQGFAGHVENVNQALRAREAQKGKRAKRDTIPKCLFARWALLATIRVLPILRLPAAP